jgi:hypothetical protein
MGVKSVSALGRGRKKCEIGLLEPLVHLQAAVSGLHFQRAVGATGGETEHNVERAPGCRSSRQEANGRDRGSPELKAIALFSHSIGIDAATR